MKNKELLPCPFCGGENAQVCQHMTFYYVRCMTCGAKGPDHIYSDRVREMWNRRTNTIPVGNGKDYTVVNE